MNLFSRSFFFLLAPSVKQVIDVGSLGGPRGMQGRRIRRDRSGGRSPAHILADQLILIQHRERGVIMPFTLLLPHTDRFLVEMFHNCAFKECISVEKLKLWLLTLTLF